MKGGPRQFPVRYTLAFVLAITSIILMIVGGLADRGVIGEGSDCSEGSGRSGGFFEGREGKEGFEGREGFKGCDRSVLGRVLMGVGSAVFFVALILALSICCSARRR